MEVLEAEQVDRLDGSAVEAADRAAGGGNAAVRELVRSRHAVFRRVVIDVDGGAEKGRSLNPSHDGHFRRKGIRFRASDPGNARPLQNCFVACQKGDADQTERSDRDKRGKSFHHVQVSYPGLCRTCQRNHFADSSKSRSSRGASAVDGQLGRPESYFGEGAAGRTSKGRMSKVRK